MLSRWSVFLTTVPERRYTTLPRTLKSLKSAGFNPHIFVDGNRGPWEELEDNGYVITYRPQRLRVCGSWLLAATETYIRNPGACKFLALQDDLVCCKNLKQYLEESECPISGYCNLVTFPNNTTTSSPEKAGWHLSNQRGKGAVALLFRNNILRNIVGSSGIIDRFQDEARGWEGIDGAICSILGEKGIREYVHSPSLVQHIGAKSSIGHNSFPVSDCFCGEDFDATSLLKKN